MHSNAQRRRTMLTGPTRCAAHLHRWLQARQHVEQHIAGLLRRCKVQGRGPGLQSRHGWQAMHLQSVAPAAQLTPECPPRMAAPVAPHLLQVVKVSTPQGVALHNPERLQRKVGERAPRSECIGAELTSRQG